MIRRVLRDIAQVVPAGTSTDFGFAGSRWFSGLQASIEIALRSEVAGWCSFLCWVLCRRWLPLKADGSGRLIVSGFPPSTAATSRALKASLRARLLNQPDRFHGEEKIRLLAERFLWSPVFYFIMVFMSIEVPSGRSAGWRNTALDELIEVVGASLSPADRS